MYVNYYNYFKKDTNKLEITIESLNSRIIKEERLFSKKEYIKDIKGSKDYSIYFFDGKNYSEAMGEVQKSIEKAAKGLCTIVNIQWKEMPVASQTSYDILGLRLNLECTAKNFILFHQNSRKNSKLLYFNQLQMSKMNRKNLLTIRTEVFAYRSKNDEK
jgi:hypothetical protein